MRKKAQSTELDEFEESKISKFQWFLLIFIPLLFAVVVALIVLTVAGVDVVHKAKEIGDKIPFTESLSSDGDEKEKKEATNEAVQDSKKLAELEKKITEKDKEIKKLEDIIDTRDQSVEKAEAEKQQLQNQIKELQKSQDASKQTFSDLIRTYETMAPKKAAPILTEMGEADAVKILSSMKADVLADVLEQMAAADAARLTKKLAEQSS